MDDAFDRAERIIADRIAAFLRTLLKLARVRHELPCNRIKRIGGVDQVSHRRRDGDGIARGDFRKLVDALARHQRVVAKFVNTA